MYLLLFLPLFLPLIYNILIKYNRINKIYSINRIIYIGNNKLIEKRNLEIKTFTFSGDKKSDLFNNILEDSFNKLKTIKKLNNISELIDFNLYNILTKNVILHDFYKLIPTHITSFYNMKYNKFQNKQSSLYYGFQEYKSNDIEYYLINGSILTTIDNINLIRIKQGLKNHFI